MSSSGGNRKSMDDVLSSIRRIIGTDRKDDDMAERDLSGTGEPTPPPLDLGAPMSPGQPPAAQPPAAQPQAPQGDPDPLPLTSNMRVGGQAMSEDDATRIAAAHRATPGFPPAGPPASPPPAPAPADHDDAMEIDEAALEEMIRRIVREEIEALVPAPTPGPTEDDMRRVVREELGGDIGQNISRNVQALIQSEVRRLTGQG